MATKQVINAILAHVRACDTAQLCTINLDGYPETRDVTNAMNREAETFPLYFLTTRKSPKVAQLAKNPRCGLYFFDRHAGGAMRLFGKIKMIDDDDLRHEFWCDDFTRYGLSGPDDINFVLLQFDPIKYKYYLDWREKTGDIK